MTQPEPKIVLNALVKSLAVDLLPHGFSLRGRTFRKLDDGNLGLIDLQSSSSTTNKAIKFTFNIGIVCSDLPLGGGVTLKNAGEVDAHLRQRIGSLMPARVDYWWVITPHTDLAALQIELSSTLREFAVPYLEKHSKTAALYGLWKSGSSPGLTSGQCEKYIAILRLRHPELDDAKA